MVNNKLLGFLVSLFVFCFSSFFFTLPAFAFSGSGSGTSGSPYLVTTCNQLEEMQNNLSAYYKQVNNINCTGVSYVPVGSNPSFFTGTLDGGGYTISNLTISSSGDTGLIGAASGATVTNVHITSGTITTTGTYAGSIIGENQNLSTVSYCSSQASITSSGLYVGGLVGLANNTINIQKSWYNGSLTLNNSYYLGGIIAILNVGASTISDSYSSGTYTATDNPVGVGGVLGIDNGTTSTIGNVYSNATITVSGANNVGGLIGILENTTLSNSFAAVTINGTMTHKGGVTGSSGGVSTNNYFDATLAGTSNCSGTGALSCTVENSGNSSPNYFQGNSSNNPLNTWDFINTWQINSNGYPTLHSAGYVPPSSGGGGGGGNSSGSPSAPTCGNAAPTNTPNLFQVSVKGPSATVYFVPVSGQNSGYYISYGVNSDASGFGTQFSYSNTSGVIPYTINALFPGTWYFKVRGQNGCMPGNWSGVMSVKVSSFGLSSTSAQVATNNVLGAATVATTNIVSCSNYTVQTGDSLWSIASSHLGNGSQFGIIVQKNNLSSSLIHTGQVLKVGC